MNIKDLLLLQSVFHCGQIDMVQLMSMQHNCSIFYHIMFELDKQNMIYMMAYLPKCIKFLLSEKNKVHFDDCDEPVILLSKSPVKCFTVSMEGQIIYYIKFKYQSPIDRALECGQNSNLQLLIEHVVKYQNSYNYANLFQHNLINIIYSGIKTHQIF